MTAGAVAPERAAVNVVEVVAGRALRALPDGPVDRARVATQAVEPFMGTGEREVGLDPMVEPPSRPAVRVVATLAVRSELAIVRVGLRVADTALAADVAELRRLVTRFARLHCVQPQERKPGDIVIETNLLPPARVAVTTAAVVALTPGMSVVVEMAGCTFRRKFFLLRVRAMALLTGGLRVLAVEWEVRLLGVIEAHLLPAPLRMAARAVAPVAPPMDVVSRVASDATVVELLLLERPRMAGTAIHPGMAVRQRKIRLLAMIEDRRVPLLRRVAARAVATELPAVDIIGRVTGTAVRRSSLVTFPHVTQAARHALVLPFEREIGLRVVELGSAPPFRLVAAGAVLPETTAVRIVLAVAVRAVGAGRSIRLAFAVAITACDRTMLALEIKVRESMSEVRGVEPQDVGSAALVLGMAVPTARSPNARVSPVQPGLIRLVLSHILVAGRAQRVLARFAPQRPMTRRAIGLDVRVERRNRPRHHELLELEGPGIGWYEGQRHEDGRK